VTAAQVLDELRGRGIRIERRPAGKLWLTPASAAYPALRELVLACKDELLALLSPPAPVVVELIWIEPQPKVTPVSPKFPPCRKCGTRRYWISDSGKVVCGGRGCGEVNFLLASIEYHPIA